MSTHTFETTAESRRVLAQELAGTSADRYLLEHVSTCTGGQRGAWDIAGVRARLEDPTKCLSTLFDRYAFAKRGKDRRPVADVACAALAGAVQTAGSLSTAPPESVWEEFERISHDRRRKPQPDLNYSVVTGLVELAQAVLEECGTSLAALSADTASATGRIEPIFHRLVGVRGIGPKVASTILRDWTFVFGVEEAVAPKDTIYLQPIDRWVRLGAPALLEEEGAAEFADWILAGKLGKAARTAEVSGIRVNMGLAWLGHVANHSDGSEEHFLALLSELSSMQAALPPQLCPQESASG